MKQSLLRSCILHLSVLCCVPAFALAAKEDAARTVPNTVVVRLKPGAVTLGNVGTAVGAPEVYASRQLLTDRQSISANVSLRKKLGVLSNSKYTQMVQAEQPLLRTFVLKYSGTEDPHSFAQRLMKNNPAVEIAEPSYIPRHLGAPNDPMLSQQEILTVVRALEAWDIYDGDASMVVAVSDDGVNQQHEDLTNSLHINTGEIPNNDIDDDGNGYVDDYNGYNFAADDDDRPRSDTYNTRQHGTSVAGILGATANNNLGIAGVAGKCKIFPLKIAPFGTQTLDYGYESIIYAAVNGFKVLNCSWGIDIYSDINQSIIDFAVSRDVAIIAAGGNDGDSRLIFPAGYRGVMGVANSWPDDTLYSGSNYGAHVDITAPGEGAMSTANSGYIAFGGTSGAAPIVAGAMAILRAQRPELTAPQAIEFLRRCTDDISGQNPDKPELVPGRLNMLKAVTLNPFDQPGVALVSYEMKNQAGEINNRFSVGEEISLVFSLKNYLGACDGVLCTLSIVSDPDESLQPLVSEVVTPALASGQTITIDALKLKKLKENPSTVFLRVDMAGDNDYHSYFIIPFRPTLGFAVFSNDSLEFAMTDGGQVGFENRMEYPEDRGFHLRTFGNFLFEGGVMACEGNNRVVSATRSHLWDGAEQTTAVDRDFVALKAFLSPDRNTGVIRDDNAAVPIGLEIRQQVRIPSSTSRITAVDVTVKNVSGTTLNDVSVGYFFDWDIGRYGEDNTMEIVHDGPVGADAQMVWGVASRPGLYPVVGCGVYTASPGAVRQFAEFDNYSSAAGNPFTTGVGFSQSDKILSLTSGTTLRYPGSGDVGCVTGMMFPGAWQSGESRSFTLLLGAAWTPQELQQALDAYWIATSVGEPQTDGIPSVQLSPQPAQDVVAVSGTAAGAFATLTVVDALGLPVLAPVVVPAGGADFRAHVDTRRLASGVYFLRVQDSGAGVVTVPLVIVK